MASFHLAALNINYDLAKDGAFEFAHFLTKIEQRFMSADTSLRDRLDLVKRTVCIYTWKKLEDVYEQLERSWLMNARGPNHFRGAHGMRQLPRMRQPSPHGIPQLAPSPIFQDPVRFGKRIA